MTTTDHRPELANVCRMSADRLETFGWAQETNEDRNGARCLTATINGVGGFPPGTAWGAVFEPFAGWLVANRVEQIRQAFHLEGRLPRWVEDAHLTASGAMIVIQKWNDYRGIGITHQGARTKDEVVAALREFANSLAGPAADRNWTLGATMTTTDGTQMTPPALAEVARRAAERLEVYGWTQGRNDSNGARCLAAAINTAGGLPLGYSWISVLEPFAGWLVARRAEQVRQVFAGIYAQRVVEEILRGNFESVAALSVVQSWNDYRGEPHTGLGARTKEEVVNALREFADDVERAPAVETPGL